MEGRSNCQLGSNGGGSPGDFKLRAARRGSINIHRYHKLMVKLPLRSRPGQSAYLLLCAILMILWNWRCFAIFLQLRMNSLPNFWGPTLVREIKWSVCPDDTGSFCSFLKVPLEYGSTQDYATVAMRMYPATVPPSQRLGTIFTNPGVRRDMTRGDANSARTGPRHLRPRNSGQNRAFAECNIPWQVRYHQLGPARS